jgi:hypothetical protein
LAVKSAVRARGTRSASGRRARRRKRAGLALLAIAIAGREKTDRTRLANRAALAERLAFVGKGRAVEKDKNKRKKNIRINTLVTTLINTSYPAAQEMQAAEPARGANVLTPHAAQPATPSPNPR